jgi:ATP synthase I chain
MDEIRETQKKYCSRAMLAAIFVGLVFILTGQNAVGKGLILGTLFSIINFILMGETIPLKIGKSRGKSFFFSLGSIFFRFAILAIPLIIGIKSDKFNLFAVIGGIFMVQIIILADHIIQTLLSTRSNHV